MKQARLTLGVVLSALLLFALSPVRADYVVKDGTGASQTIKAGTLGSCSTGPCILPWYLLVDGTGAAFGTAANPLFVTGSASNASSAVAASANNQGVLGFLFGWNGTTWDQLQVDGSKFLKVNCASGCTSGSISNASSAVATSSTNLGAVSYLYAYNGATWDQLQADGSKFLKVNCAAGCTGAADTTANLSGMTANNAATQIALVGTNSVSVLLSGTWVGTLVPEVSADGGTTWVTTQFYNVNSHTSAGSVTANGTYDITGTGGKSHARVRISAYTSGTVTGNLKATSQAPSSNDAQAQLNVIAQQGTGSTASTAPTTAYLDGGVAQSSEPTAATAGNLTPFSTDLAHKLINLPYANPENFLNGQITSAMTSTTSTAVTGMGAQGAGVRNYITACTFSNTHATVGTMINLQDGSGGAVLWQAPSGPAYAGAAVVFPTPIKTTANTGLFAANVTIGASTFVSCTGYKGV